MSILSRLARLEKRNPPRDSITAELAKFDAYICNHAEMRPQVEAQLNAILAGDETLQTFPDGPGKAFILERVNRIAEARL
jgi:hypothetical protein